VHVLEHDGEVLPSGQIGERVTYGREQVLLGEVVGARGIGLRGRDLGQQSPDR